MSASLPAMPIEHVVILMLENRSFDHLFSDLPSFGVSDVDVPQGTVTNPDGTTGLRVPRQLATSFCIDNGINHEWGDVHLQLNHGKMDGFVAASNAHAMDYYASGDLPVLYSLASQFAISDRHFSSLLGPTWPNRLFLLAGKSCGYAEGGDTNIDVTLQCGLTAPNLLASLDSVGASYAFYNEGGPTSVEVALGISPVLPRGLARFVSDSANNALPKVSIVGASTGKLATEDDDHPPANILLGDAFLYTVVTALGASPGWGKTVLFVTFDEHGGFYDHVRPPHACDPTVQGAPVTAEADIRDYGFDQYGFRVPLLVISPYARRHYVSHFDSDHTSITRFVEHWLNLGALTTRDANAWPLLDMFDFDHPTADLPMVTPPKAATSLVACERNQTL